MLWSTGGGQGWKRGSAGAETGVKSGKEVQGDGLGETGDSDDYFAFYGVLVSLEFNKVQKITEQMKSDLAG